MLYDIQFQMASKVDEIQVDNTSTAQLAQSLPKHYQTTKNPSKRYQEILQQDFFSSKFEKSSELFNNLILFEC